MDMESIDFGKLKEAVKALNETEGLLDKAEIQPIKTVAQKKEAMVALFTSAIEKLSEVGAEEEIPEIAISMYNEMYSEDAASEEEVEKEEEVETEEEEEVETEEEEVITEELDEDGNLVEVSKEKKEKAPKKKKEKAPKEKKEKKEKVPKEKKPPKEKKQRVEKAKSCYGQIASAKSGMLDEMMREGTTYGEIMKKLDVNRGRIQSHIKALKKMGLTVMIKDNEDPYMCEIKVKEQSLIRIPKEEKSE
jgi:hypothetical protein